MVSEKTLEHPVLTLMVFTLLGLMGIFSLDLNEPTTLNIHATDSEMGPILEAIKPYIVSEDPK